METVTNSPREFQMRRMCERQGQRDAGFNPARAEDVKPFVSVPQGEHELHAFCNADMGQQLRSEAKTKADKHRQANVISRLLQRLHERGLIAKISVRVAGESFDGDK